MDPSSSSTSRELQNTQATSSTSLASAASSSSSNKDNKDNNGNGNSHIASPPPTLPQRTPSSSSINKSAHRQSFVEGLRNTPSSPRSHRHPSFTQAAVQELLNHPPAGNKHANPKFAGRDWRDVTVGELVSPDDVRWVEIDQSIEDATKLLLKSPTNVVLVRENPETQVAISTFDYTDLNVYLLLVVGLLKPGEDQVDMFNTILSKVREGAIPLRDVQPLFRKESLVNLAASEQLIKGIQVLGSGIHRLLVTAPSGDVIGIMSQLRLVEFFWNEGVNFPSIERLYPVILRDLGIGTKDVFSVNSDAPLSEALTLMNNEGLTSVAVVDNGLNVVGNISTKDVRHLTSTSNAHLLNQSCMGFISVILNERGVEKGKDAFPVFYVNPYSTLAHTVAKLVATRSHRMWVVESASPSPSAPATPLMGPQGFPAAPPAGAAPPSPALASAVPVSAVPVSAVPASAMAGARLSGRLSGVISLTDVLNMFARSTGLSPTDPGEQRARRRRSSSSSVRPSLDSARASADLRR